jgi:hypothetical protein
MGCPMNALLRSWALPAGLLAAVGIAVLPGCGEDKKKNVETDAGVEQGPQKPVLGGKLAAAVKAAESAQASQSKAGADGPPENGFFGPGLADKAQAPGAPPKIELVGEGAEPRFSLAPAPADEQKETASVTVRLQGGAIPVEYALALKVDKPKDEKKTDGPRSVKVVAKVAAVQLPSQISRDAGDKLGKLKGTEIRYVLGPAGGVSDLAYTLPKDADPGLGEAVIKGLADSIGLSMPPLPPKPVGVGAVWMVTDRSSTFGVEVVRYRLYKIERIDKDGAGISLDVRQYAAKDEVEMGQKMTLGRFESAGKGKIDWAPAGLLPPKGESSLRTALAGTVAAGQQGSFQADVSARFATDTGEKKK